MPDEYEKRKNGVGVARPGANMDANAERLSRDQIQERLGSSESIEFTSREREER